VISAGRYSPVSGALAFWGLFCTVTLLFYTVPVLVVFSALGGCGLVFYQRMGQVCFRSFMDPSIYTFTCLVAVYSEVRGIYLPFSGPVITFWCALCGGFLYSAADFLRSAHAFGLLSVSFLLLLLRGASNVACLDFCVGSTPIPTGLTRWFLGAFSFAWIDLCLRSCPCFCGLAFGHALFDGFSSCAYFTDLGDSWSFQGCCCAGAVHSFLLLHFCRSRYLLCRHDLVSNMLCCLCRLCKFSFIHGHAFVLSAGCNTCREVILLALRLSISWSSSTIVVCGS